MLTSAAGATTTTTTPDPSPSSFGYVEICKSFTPPTITENTTPTFSYSVTGIGSVTLQAGSGSFSCTKPMKVAAGSVTITEVPGSWYQVSSITEPAGDSYITSSDTSTGTVTVNVPAGQSATVQYTNDPVYGWVEVCKDTQSGSPLTGSFTYSMSGENGFTGTTTANVGQCSLPVKVPAGSVQVTEENTNLYVTSITANYDGTGQSALQAPAPDLQTGTASVWAAPGTSAATETTVYYEDNVVQFKVCKAWIGGTPPVPTFPFSLSSSGPAGPTAVPASLSVPAGTPKAPVCSNPIPLRAGTTVAVTEGIVPGTKVASIATSGALSLATTPATNPDPVNRTVQVVIGQPTTSATNIVNEATVTFSDQAADPGALKLCVQAGTSAPAGSSYNFSVSGAPGVVTNVAVGGCSFVGGSTSPTMFPFNSVQTVTGTNVSPDVTQAVALVPAFVTEYLNGAIQTTSTPTLVGSADLSTPAVSLRISEGGTSLTQVHFQIAGKSSGTGGSSGSSGTGGSTGSSASSGAGGSSGTVGAAVPVVVADPPAASVDASSTSPATTTSATVSSNVVAAQRAHALAFLKASLARVNHDIVLTRHAIGKYRAAARHAAVIHSSRHAALVRDVDRLVRRLHTLLGVRVHLIGSIRKLG